MNTLLTHGLGFLAGGTVVWVLARHVGGMLTQWEASLQADVAHLKGMITGAPPPIVAKHLETPATPPPAAVHAQ